MTPRYAEMRAKTVKHWQGSRARSNWGAGGFEIKIVAAYSDGSEINLALRFMFIYSGIPS